MILRSSKVILEDVKQEPAVDFLLILLKQRDTEVRPQDEFLRPLEELPKLDTSWSKNSNLFETLVVCERCKRVFKSPAHLTQHSCVQCDLCSRLFTSKSVLRKHMVKHLKKFFCADCGEAFRIKESLRNHENPAELWKCQVCLELFKCKSFFKHHVESHGVNFKCSYANYGCFCKSCN